MNQPQTLVQRLANCVAQRLRVFEQIHRDERGGVSIETVLIIAAIALPILIYIIKVGWPRMQAFFNTGMQSLEDNAGTMNNGS